MLWLYPNLLRCYSVRPIFLGCCVLAFKVPREEVASLSYLLSRVQDVFNLLDVRLLSRIEQQLLEVLSSQPAPSAPRPHLASLCPTAYVRQTVPMMRCRRWTGGSPWRPGNIKPTPTSSSAWQRTRSSRRPCRPHRYSCRGNRRRCEAGSTHARSRPEGRSLTTPGDV